MKQRYNNKNPEKKKYNDSLKVENRKLRKELQQMRRQLQKMDYREEEIKEFIDEFEIENRGQEIKAQLRTCPACGSPRIKVLEKLRNGIDYYNCEECDSRGQLK